MKRCAIILASLVAAFSLSACNPYVAPLVPDVAVALAPAPPSTDAPQVAVAPPVAPCVVLAAGDGAPLPAGFVDYERGVWYDAAGNAVGTALTEDSVICAI